MKKSLLIVVAVMLMVSLLSSCRAVGELSGQGQTQTQTQASAPSSNNNSQANSQSQDTEGSQSTTAPPTPEPTIATVAPESSSTVTPEPPSPSFDYELGNYYQSLSDADRTLATIPDEAPSGYYYVVEYWFPKSDNWQMTYRYIGHTKPDIDYSAAEGSWWFDFRYADTEKTNDDFIAKKAPADTFIIVGDDLRAAFKDYLNN